MPIFSEYCAISVALPPAVYSIGSSLKLQAYSDATWVSSLDNRYSVTDYYLFLGSSLVVWKTKKQTNVARSNVEAEIRALESTVQEV